MTHSLSIHIDRHRPKRFIFHIIWIENQTSISVAKTLVPFGSQKPSLNLTLIGIIGDSTEWQGGIRRRSAIHSFLRVHASSLTDGEIQVTPCWTCPCHWCSVKTEDNRTFDPALPSSIVYCHCLCAYRLPFHTELMSRSSKAVKACLWSVIRPWQVLRGSWQDSQPCQLWQELRTVMLIKPIEQKAFSSPKMHHTPER